MEAEGGTLRVVIDRANVYDTKPSEATIESMVAKRPDPMPEPAWSLGLDQNLRLDKGYANATGREMLSKHRYAPHIPRIGEEKSIPREEEVGGAMFSSG